MDELLETCNLLKLNYEETENLNRLTTNREIETIMKTQNSQKTKAQA